MFNARQNILKYTAKVYVFHTSDFKGGNGISCTVHTGGVNAAKSMQSAGIPHIELF